MEITLPSGLNVDFGEASQEEVQDALEAMREQDPSLFEESVKEPQNISELIASRSSGGERSADTPARPKVEITNAAELEPLYLQYDYAKADNDAGRADWLTKRYGPCLLYTSPSPRDS